MTPFPHVTHACMGGWCTLRDKCGHYTAPSTRNDPAERLCDTGHEQRMHFLPSQTYQTRLTSQLPSQQVGE